ncbi:MAG: N-acyl-D-amino-acid deacylase [Paraglaciecola sp.]|jgi:N-acyl-D-amino-acid deacylase
MPFRIKSMIPFCFALLMMGCNDTPPVFLAHYPQIDILIEGGRVLDGLGNEATAADVVIVGDTIVYVGETHFSASDRDTRVKQYIDATGRIVSPGFIDLHSHGDPIETPAFENFLAMGVTTITLGQDGESPETADLAAWLDNVATQRIGTNLAMFVGHGTLRTVSGIDRMAIPSTQDMANMLTLLNDTLAYTFGMSTGLEYNPGLNAQASEMQALAKVVGERDRMIMSHMRNEDDDKLKASIDELLAQGKFARVHIAHLKSVYGKGSERADEILTWLAEARESGIEVTADIYPYNASYAGVALLFPVWAKSAEQFQLAKSERRAELEEYLRNRITRRNGPEATLMGTDPYTGKTLADLSREMEMPFEQVLIDVIGPQGAAGAYFVMNDALQSTLLADPNVSICSDGRPTGFHPRGHGTFAKIIEEYVNKRHLLSLTQAVRKMTSQPAAILGLEDRGVVAVDKKADLLIFNPKHIKATATYPQPLQLAKGFDVVIVNGHVARQDDKLAPTLSGRVLKP